MHETESKRRAANSNAQAFKYHGKWPFIRIMGAQEICSVVFSALNLLAHVFGFIRLIRLSGRHNIFSVAHPSKTHSFLTSAWMVYSITHILAWASSSVFHARDTPITERVDYILADTVVAFGFICSATRLFSEPFLPINRRLASNLQMQTVFLTITCLGCHVHHMLLVKFDYDLNMKRCVIVGLLTSLFWLTWLKIVRGKGHPTAHLLLSFILLAYASLLLELLDFPPLLGLLDAHAIWHMCTIPLTFKFYRFIIGDLSHQENQETKKAAPAGNRPEKSD